MASWYDKDKQGVYFSLFSSSASSVQLYLFNADKMAAIITPKIVNITERNGNIWSIFIEDIAPGICYGFGIDHQPSILLDPEAKRVTEINNQLLAVVVGDDDYEWQGDRHPHTSWQNTIIYEAHVKGLTKLYPEIPEDIRGTYAALAHPKLVDYLVQLGITAIELMPIQHHLDEPFLYDHGLSNYWGYNVIAPFAVEPSYWSKRKNSTASTELKDAVKALHKVDIEVILDVVFNHTAELDEAGPVLSLKGIDKQSYYWLMPTGQLANWSGCGNTLKLTEPEVIQWVMDCLRYWVSEYHIDGFRFDLGTVLGRTPDFNPHSVLLTAIRQDPILKQLKLIAEPWDIGDNGYQLGQFPYPFAEWNDQYRDDMRRFWLHGDVSLGLFAQRFAASSQFFNHHGRKPSSSINFLTCHDGFTLRDLVSFNYKHNEENGESNRDGNNVNWSYNFGVEGLADVSTEIKQQRQSAQQALLAILLLSQGTPMLLAGDEWGNSQQGNNNSYCQDNKIGWLNWQDKNDNLFSVTAQLIALRKKIVALTINRWWKTDSDVCWLNQHGEPLSTKEWQDCHHLAIQIELSQQCLILINASDHACDFSLDTSHWQIILGNLTSIPGCSGYWQCQKKTIVILTYCQQGGNV